MAGPGRAAGRGFALALLLAAGPARFAGAETPAENPTPEAPAQDSPQESAPPQPAGDYEEYDDLYFDEEFVEEDTGDPLEGANRLIFTVNDGLDRFALEPIATGLDYAIPDVAQRALRSAFDNLRFPVLFFNDLFQLKPREAGEDLARFLINTTIGIGGLMDPAATIGLRKRSEDFGQTLGYWGVPAGPYLMLPFFGPSNIRDGAGLIVDTGFRALGFFIPLWVSLAMESVDTLNRRSLIREEIQAERRAALDWYSAVRSAYTQYRENLIHDRREGAEADSYYSTLGSEAAGEEPDGAKP